jgi:hypothetical protein
MSGQEEQNAQFPRSAFQVLSAYLNFIIIENYKRIICIHSV